MPKKKDADRRPFLLAGARRILRRNVGNSFENPRQRLYIFANPWYNKYMKQKGSSKMKKTGFLIFLALSSCFLTSCQVNWFGASYDVAWYWVAIPVAVIMVVGYVILMRIVLVCPVCGEVFRPRWYQLSVSMHMGRKRLAKCPHCGKRSFCRRYRGE